MHPIDPLNQLPTDPAWLKRCDELNAFAAKELGCMVLMVALQDRGKLAVTCHGEPTAGPLFEMAQDVPRFLATVAAACAMQDQYREEHGGPPS